MKKILGIGVFMLSLLMMQCDSGRPNSGCPEAIQNFFEVNSLEVINVLRCDKSGNFIENSKVDSTMQNSHIFTDNENLHFVFKFNVTFFDVVEATKPSIFNLKNISLFPQAYADIIPCAFLNGNKGTPDQVANLTIKSLKDYDTNHLANTNLNDLVEINAEGYFNPIEPWLENVLYKAPFDMPFSSSVYVNTYQIRFKTPPTRQQVIPIVCELTFKDGRKFNQLIGNIYFQ